MSAAKHPDIYQDSSTGQYFLPLGDGYVTLSPGQTTWDDLASGKAVLHKLDPGTYKTNEYAPAGPNTAKSTPAPSVQIKSESTTMAYSQTDYDKAAKALGYSDINAAAKVLGMSADALVKTVNPSANLMTPAPAAVSTPQPTTTYASSTPAPAAAPTAPKVAAPTVALQPGSTNTTAVKQLQDYLVSAGYMTQAQVNTGYGTYGPQTTAAVTAWQVANGVDNSTGPGYWGPRSIAKIPGTTPSAPAVTGISDPASTPTLPTTAGASSTSLNLPTNPTGGASSATYAAGLTATIASLKDQIQKEADKRAADYQKQIDTLNQKQKDLQVLQDAGMHDLASTVESETKAKQAELDLEKQRFDENYNANQALVAELDTLLTQGNQVISQMQETTGLASIMEPRIAKTMTDIAARAGVIQAVMNARNGQMANAQNQLSSAVSAISSIYQDQIDYYKSVVNFYGALKDENGKQISSLSTEQKDYLDVKINSLTNDLAQVQSTAKMVTQAMLDPSTASAYASAGVSLTDSPELIAQKLATHSYSDELVTINNKMTSTGYTRSAIAGVTPVQIADSQGKITNWYKAPAQTDGFTLGTNQVRFDASGNVVAAGPKAASTTTTAANGTKLSASDKQILLGANFTAADIPNLEHDVQTYGLDKVLTGITNSQQKAALRKVYGATAKVTKADVASSVTQKIAQDGLSSAYTDAELQQFAADAGYRHWYTSWASEKNTYLNSDAAKQKYVDLLYQQYKDQGLAE